MSSTISAAAPKQFVAPPKPVESKPVASTQDAKPKASAAVVNTANEKMALQDKFQAEEASQTRDTENVENAREKVQRLYEATRLESSQQISRDGSMRGGAIDTEQQRSQESAEVRSAMAQDKAAAQEAQLKASREVIQDKVTLAKEQNYREQFESFALAREMIALRDSELDKIERQISGEKMLFRELKSNAQQGKVLDEKNMERFREQSAKMEKASSRRLDMITPGSFEVQPKEPTPQAPDVQIIQSLRQSHQIDLEPSATSAEQVIEKTEVDRSEAARQFDQVTMGRSEESGKSSASESVSRVLTEMKDTAARNGLITLNSSDRAEQVAEEVIREARRRPEQAIASQSQVSLQAALKMLQ